jgi:hypothetical protein
MKTVSLMRRKLIALGVIIGLILPTFLCGYPTGITGRTLKSTSSGCGSCHSSSPSLSVSVSITSPDTVIAGQVYTDTITVTGGSGTTGGVDIATFRGMLAVVSSTLKVSNGELTHKARLSVPFAYQFSYTAPATAGTDTLYANGKGADFNSWNWAVNKVMVVKLSTGIVDNNNYPSDFRLLQNYPNPFNPTTTIHYSIPQSAAITLKIYDIDGKEINTLVNEIQQPGEHGIVWSSEGYPSGVYMYRIAAGNYTETKKMVLLK